MSRSNEEQLAQSWLANAEGWTAAVRERRIESRRLVTDEAIVRSVTTRSPRRVLDVGCGEGWLCRALAARGIEAVGVDASEPLVRSARALGGAFHVLSYEELAADPHRLGRFDAAVLNFAVLDEDAAGLLTALRQLLAPAGTLFVQTTHPWAASGDGPYRDGWRTETFSAFGPGFSEPMPWFFRTLTSWTALLRHAGFHIEELHEPLHPETGRPLSLLFICVPG